MTRKTKADPATISSEAATLDGERKGALANLRTMRGTGQKNLLFGCKIRDVRELIDSPAMGCGIAALIEDVVRDPRKRASVLERGETIYAEIRGAGPLAAGETLLLVDPTEAGRVAMALAGAGLKPTPRHAGWAGFRGPVTADAVRSLLDDRGIVADAYRLHEIDAYAPPASDEGSAGPETVSVQDAAMPGEPSARQSSSVGAGLVPATAVNGEEDDISADAAGRPADADPVLATDTTSGVIPDPSEVAVEEEPACDRVDTPLRTVEMGTATLEEVRPSRLFGVSEEVLNRLLYPASTDPVSAEPDASPSSSKGDKERKPAHLVTESIYDDGKLSIVRDVVE